MEQLGESSGFLKGAGKGSLAWSTTAPLLNVRDAVETFYSGSH